MMIVEKGAEWALEEGHISVKDYQQVRNNVNLYKMIKNKIPDNDELQNEWHYGKSGAGKSSYVR